MNLSYINNHLYLTGKLLLGLTHEETVDLLKTESACLTRRVMVVFSRPHSDTSGTMSPSSMVTSPSMLGSMSFPNTPPLAAAMASTVAVNTSDTVSANSHKTIKAEITKDVNGLGFIIEGGKNGSFGDRPIVIKRIFRGLCFFSNLINRFCLTFLFVC